MVLLDCRASLDSLLFGSAGSFVRKYADEAIYVADATQRLEALAEAAGLLEKALDKRVSALANKSDLLRRKPAKASLLQSRAASWGEVFFVSAIEKSGYSEFLAGLGLQQR